MFMNEYEVEEATRLFLPDEVPNLAAAANMLNRLMEWANANSDGWAYWNKPQNAARRLIATLQDKAYPATFGHDREGNPLTDISDADLTRLLSPVKGFLTKQGVSLRDVFA